MTALMLPVQSGATQLAREVIEEIERYGANDLAACCERLGIERMSWYLAVLPARDHLIVHVQGRESELILSRLAASRHQFDRWLYASLTEITGQDIEQSDAVQWLLPLVDIHANRAAQGEQARQ